MSRENPATPFWTYRMEVSPSGQGPSAPAQGATDPMALLQLMVNLQAQSGDAMRQMLEMQRQSVEMQKQALDLARDAAKMANDQRARQIQELEKWQNSHDGVLDNCKTALEQLEKVHASLMTELAEHVDTHFDNLIDADFSLSDFVDRFGPRLAHLNTMLAVLRPLAAAQRRQPAETPAD